MDLPLHSYPYAEKHLNPKEWVIKSFQIVWRCKAKSYEVHVVVEKEVDVDVDVVNSNPKSVVGIDLGLGLKRLATSYEANGEGDRVTFTPKEDYKEFFIQMRRLNNRR